MKTDLQSFVEQFIALVTGDDAKAQGEKCFRQARTALNSHIACYDGDTIDLEEALGDAKEHLAKARVNFGKPITDRKQYIIDLINAKNTLTIAETALEDHETTLKFLKSELLEVLKQKA